MYVKCSIALKKCCAVLWNDFLWMGSIVIVTLVTQYSYNNILWCWKNGNLFISIKKISSHTKWDDVLLFVVRGFTEFFFSVVVQVQVLGYAFTHMVCFIH